MKSNTIKIGLLFLILLSLTIINCQNNFPNISKDDIKKKEFKVNKRKESIPKRKLDSEFLPYHIYLDLFNFERTIPDSLKVYKNIIISSMQKAKKTLESLIQIIEHEKGEIITYYSDLTDNDITSYNNNFIYIF